MAILTPQLPLSVGLRDSTTFENFLVGDNPEALAYLRRLPDDPHTPPVVYLWGAPGCGKSHLLQALCHQAASGGQPAFYLPLRSADEFTFEALQGLEQMRVICLDDLQAIRTELEWSHALVELFERIRAARGILMATGAAPAPELGLLPALSSRLASGISFQLHPLNPGQCVAALQLRAQRRGMRLAEDSARYLVRQRGDNLERLFASLETLDRASLAAKRKLTLPFVRSVVGSGG